MNKVDYTITVHEERDGYFLATSSVPGLILCHPDLNKFLADVPNTVAVLRRLNGDERTNG